MRRFVAFLVALMMLYISVGAALAKDGQFDTSLREGETRQTLEPSLFGHPKIRAAYQAAKQIPWVLDSIYCYCRCKESPVFRHKSLLSCYVDNHAAM